MVYFDGVACLDAVDQNGQRIVRTYHVSTLTIVLYQRYVVCVCVEH
jgi:hypothetical protein